MTIPPGIADSRGGSGGGGGGSGVGTYDFAYTGAEQSLTVAAGVAYARVKMWGGGGQGGWYGGGRWGGNGGFVHAVVPVAAGDILRVHAAQGGQWTGFATNNPGGWPDGGAGAWGDASGGGGGGSSRVFLNTTVAVVAGGGAGAAGFAGWGGGGGGSEGGVGQNGTGSIGTQTTPGYLGGTALHWNNGGSTGGGFWENGGGPLTFANRLTLPTVIGGYGGPQGASTFGDGGGGGGGYYGGAGGGGDARSGGGGSGYVMPGASVLDFPAATYSNVVPNGSTDPAYPGAPVARGTESNTGVSAGNGFVRIELLAAPVEDTLPTTLPQNASITHWFAGGVGARSDNAGAIPCFNNDPVALWQNNGSSTQDAIQTVAANRPIFKTAGLGGKSYIECDRSLQQFFADFTDITNGSGITTTTIHTVAFVVDAVDITDESPLFGSTVNMGKTTISLFDNAGTASVKWFKTQNVRAAAVGGPIIIIVAANSASAFRRMIAGVFEQFIQATNPNSAAITATQFLRNTALSDFFDGRLYEVIRWSTYLTQTEMQEVDDYFFGKYGI